MMKYDANSFGELNRAGGSSSEDKSSTEVCHDVTMNHLDF